MSTFTGSDWTCHDCKFHTCESRSAVVIDDIALAEAYGAEARALERVAELEADLLASQNLVANAQRLATYWQRRAQDTGPRYTAAPSDSSVTLVMHFEGKADTFLVGNYPPGKALEDAKARALVDWPDALFSTE